MESSLDKFAKAVRKAREEQKISQRDLAQKLNMNTRTIMDLEIGRSNQKAETIFLIASELHISLDSILFTNASKPNAVSADVLDFFSDKDQATSKNYIDVCRKIETINNKEISILNEVG